MKDKIRQLVREEIKSILHEDATTDLEKKLKYHDWYYNYSDDGRAYRKGKKERDEIYNTISSVDLKTAKVLWSKYAPKDYSFPIGRFKDKK